MAVKYLYGTEAGYQQLKASSRLDDWAFYRTVDTQSKLKNLYFGPLQLSSAEDIDGVLRKVGDLSSLNTTEKTSLVSAINEVLATGGGTVSVATDTTPGIMKLYSAVGLATDGTMTQKAITEELNKKPEIEASIPDETLIFKYN